MSRCTACGSLPTDAPCECAKAYAAEKLTELEKRVAALESAAAKSRENLLTALSGVT